LLWLSDRMHALHHAAFWTPVAEPVAPEESKSGERRFFQLLSSPGLMRLFGWARDAWLVFDEPLPARRQVVQVIPEYPSAADEVIYGSVAADLDVGRLGFFPIAREDGERLLKGDTETSDRAGTMVMAGPGMPKYHATSVETVCAVEEDAQAVNARPDERHPLPRLVTGPLALTRLKPEPKEPEPKKEEWRSGQRDVFFAEHLAAPARLDIGVELQDGTTSWHRTSARIISHIDDDAQRREQDWPTRTISALCPDWMPAHEREAAGVAQMEVVQTLTNRGNPCKDERVAAYAGEDLGAPPNHPPLQAVPGQRLSWEQEKIELGKEPNHGDLLVGQRITTARGSELPPLRFGWSYRFALRRAFWGGAGPRLDAARAAYRESGTVFPHHEQPAVRYLRQEPVAKPMVMLAPDSPWQSSDNPQTGEQMLVGPDVLPRAGGRMVWRTSRILLPAPVPFAFAELHDVFDPRTEGEAVDIRIALENPSASQEIRRQDDPSTKPDGKDLPHPVTYVKDPQRFYRLPVKAPRQGLVMAILEDEIPEARLDKTKTLGGKLPRLRVRALGERQEVRQAPYYSDPAACFLVLRLAHPDRPDQWLPDEPPLVIRIRNGHGVRPEGNATWPDILPVRVDLVATSELGQPRLVDRGFALESGASGVDGTLPPALRVRSVSVQLAPGEEAVLKAWFAPDASDLEAWFDVVHSAAELCEAAGEKQGATAAEACRAGMAELLQRRGAGKHDPMAELSEMFHEHLTRQALTSLTEVHAIRLTHSHGRPLVAATFVEGTARIARPLSLEPEVLKPFLAYAGPAASWLAATADDGATATLVGGTITFDPATTSGLVIEALVRAPGSEQIDAVPDELPAQLVPLDPLPLRFSLTTDGNADLDDAPSEHTAGLKATWVKMLAIKQIPMPADARAKQRKLILEDVLAGKAADFEGAVIEFGAPIEQPQARQVLLRVVALPRHSTRAGLVSQPTKPLWVPATARPALPDPKIVTQDFLWREELHVHDDETIKVEGGRDVRLRLWLRRPWFTSGEGERLGIILWPPPAFAVGPDDHVQIPFELSALAELHENDLGPIGRFVSVWGHDSIEGFGASGGQHRFLGKKHFRDPTAEMVWIPHALIPLAGTDVAPPAAMDEKPTKQKAFATPPAIAAQPASYMSTEKKDGKAGADGPANRETMAAVSLLSPPVRFARDTSDGAQLPYVDLDLNLPEATSPRLRFGIVRLQLHARADERRSGDRRQGIQCSAPNFVDVDLLPSRSYTLKVTRPGMRFGSPAGMTTVTVSIRGPSDGMKESDTRRRITIELIERRGREEFKASFLPIGEQTLEPARAVWGVGSTGTVAYLPHTGEWTATFHIPGDVIAERRDLAARLSEELVLPDHNGSPPKPNADALPKFSATVALWRGH